MLQEAKMQLISYAIAKKKRRKMQYFTNFLHFVVSMTCELFLLFKPSHLASVTTTSLHIFTIYESGMTSSEPTFEGVDAS